MGFPEIMRMIAIHDIKIQDRRIEFREGGGCLAIMGIPVLVVGCSPTIALVVGV